MAVTMTGRQRVEATLRREQPDRVPFDVGSGPTTGIHERALKAWMAHRGRSDHDRVTVIDKIQQLGLPPADFFFEIGQDVWPLWPDPPAGFALEEYEDGDYDCWRDEWKVTWRKPRPHGLYYDMKEHPLALAGSLDEIMAYHWPDGADPARTAGLQARVRAIRETAGDVAIFCWSMCAGIYEMAQWLRGIENVYMDMAAAPELVTAILDRVLAIKKDYWSGVIRAVGDEVSVFFEADDFAGQHGNLVRPEMYRDLLMPRHAALVAHIKSEKPGAKVFLHSCGSIVDLLPAFIEAGFDAINPVQVSAHGMDTAWLKKEFGGSITFWGGGVDTQSILPRGTPAEVRDEVKKRMADLAPGGGFVFNPVHNVQPDVPPQNLEAMLEAFRECTEY